ncbi:MAG: hypothetical protein II986_09555 [Alistipes sp.]|nr:hypothetical protein [Alistipes sp.]
MKPTIAIDFQGQEGNIFYILLEACRAIEHSAWDGVVPWEQRELKISNAQFMVTAMHRRVQQAKNYEDALSIIEEYVTIKPKGGLPMK